MTIFSTHIDIDAPKEKVFQVVCDIEHYPDWHPSMKNIKGELELNRWIVLHMGERNKRGVKVPVIVSVLTENEKLEWQGSLFKKGALRKIFLVRHAFYVEDLGNGRTRFTNEEEFYGVLSKPVNMMRGKFIPGYRQVNEALRNFVEAK